MHSLILLPVRLAALGHALLPSAQRSPLPSGMLLLLLGAVAAGATAPASATLGQGLASVEVDRMQVQASVRHVAHPSYSVHELNTGAGGLVREYVSPTGTVFAVTWHGRTNPNLRQLLGAHFTTLADSTQRRAGGRGHLSVTQGNLVFESNGRMRSLHGRAYLSDAVPAGVTLNELE